MAVGKRLRFEVFKRDGFCCQYCGRRPPDVVLELDHIDPRVSGGSDDELNLITSCFDCNRGKADKKLGDVHPRPDADLKYLECQQEIAEAGRYLEVSLKLSEARALIRQRLTNVWREFISETYVPTDSQWNHWLHRFGPDEIEWSIRSTALKFNAGGFNGGEQTQVESAIRYASGIMYNRRKELESKEQASEVCEQPCGT